MSTEFEASVRLMLWGDQIDLPRIIAALGVDESCVSGKSTKISSRRKQAEVDTAAFEYCCDRQFPNYRREPDSQLKFLAEKLSGANETSFTDCKIEYGELQIFIYYEEKQDGHSDFYVPDDLLFQLHKHSIHMRITILP